MPGIKHLSDRKFIGVFQITDKIIQHNQAIFITIWMGSAVTIILSALLSFQHTAGLNTFIIVAVALYIIGVQLPTIVTNLPLNNRLKTLDVNTMSVSDITVARQEFESLWNRLNIFRTGSVCLVSILLTLIILKI
jgi:uncharacterized membrane protein